MDYIGFGTGKGDFVMSDDKVQKTVLKPLRKRRFQLRAPAFTWGIWKEVFAQLGVAGRDADHHITKINISFATISEAPSSFDYQIKGGDIFITGFASGTGVSEAVTITGNKATAIHVRCKSHSITQNIIITVG